MMMSESHRGCMQTKGVVVGRVLLGLLFFVSGVGMLMKGPGMSVGFYESVGIPLANLMVWVVAIVKVAAGGALIIGKRVGCASALLIVFTLIATLTAHRNIGDPMQLMAATKNLAIIGGLLYAMAFGAGSWSKSGAKSDSGVCAECGREKSTCTCGSADEMKRI